MLMLLLVVVVVGFFAVYTFILFPTLWKRKLLCMLLLHTIFILFFWYTLKTRTMYDGTTQLFCFIIDFFFFHSLEEPCLCVFLCPYVRRMCLETKLLVERALNILEI